MYIRSKKGFTLAELLVALFLTVGMVVMMLKINSNFVGALNQGVTMEFGASQADNTVRALQALANESQNIWVTPLIDSSQRWVSDNDKDSTGNNVQVGYNYIGISTGDNVRTSLMDVEIEDIPVVDTFIYSERVDYTAAADVSDNYFYDSRNIKKGFWVWFNCLDDDGDEEIRGLLEIKLLGPATSSSSSRVEYGGSAYPANANTSDSIRVTLFTVPEGVNIMGDAPVDDTARSNINSLMGVLDGYTPAHPYFNYRNARVNLELGGDGNIDSENTISSFNGNSLIMTSYVVDYRDVSELSYKSGKVLSEFALYHSIKVLPDDFNGGIVFKLPHPYDLDAKEVPPTYGVLTATWGNSRPLSISQDLGIENAAQFTLYPTYAK